MKPIPREVATKYIEQNFFGLTPTQITAVFEKVPTDIDPEYTARPINPRGGTALDVCLKGACRILDDPQKTEMFRRIYRGE